MLAYHVTCSRCWCYATLGWGDVSWLLVQLAKLLTQQRWQTKSAAREQAVRPLFPLLFLSFKTWAPFRGGTNLAGSAAPGIYHGTRLHGASSAGRHGTWRTGWSMFLTMGSYLHWKRGISQETKSPCLDDFHIFFIGKHLHLMFEQGKPPLLGIVSMIIQWLCKPNC